MVGITPSPTQTLSAGGAITFILNFSKQAAGTITVRAVIAGSEWSGAVEYTLVGQYVDCSYSVPETFNSCPAGMYTLNYRAGGPESSVLNKITPAPTQVLPPGGNLIFTLYFVPVLEGGTE